MGVGFEVGFALGFALVGLVDFFFLEGAEDVAECGVVPEGLACFFVEHVSSPCALFVPCPTQRGASVALDPLGGLNWFSLRVLLGRLVRAFLRVRGPSSLLSSRCSGFGTRPPTVGGTLKGTKPN